MIANELVDGRRRSNEKGLVWKIDLEMAYDIVDRDFLLWTLEKKGFGKRWIQWIMRCLDHPYFSVMINGVSKGFFSSSKGIRQGDPLSPFLFTLVADGFNALMSRAVDLGLIKGFRSSHSGPTVSHLQFANDTICFVDASSDQVANLKLISNFFECISGLKVNIAKSSMSGLGVDEIALNSFADNFGCKVQ